MRAHIAGRVVAVTGGARGIGREIARQLAAAGARVAIGDRDGDAVAATKHGVRGYLTGVREELRGSGKQVSVIMPAVVDTELAVGTATGAAKLLQPEDVARAVLAVITRPRFEATVPGYVGPLSRVVDVLPQRARDVVLRRLVPNQVAATHESSARTHYQSQLLTPTDTENTDDDD